MTTNIDPNPFRRFHVAQRRGNTMVLVVGILVLLVIIATGYLTRTHAGRVTAISQQRAALRDDNARALGDLLAGEVAGALFAHPIDPTRDLGVTQLPPLPADSNVPRLTPARWNPTRYGVDRDVVINATGVQGMDGLPDFPYNFAPYHVVPFTNWPDDPPDLWPPLPRSLIGKTMLDPPFSSLPMREGNPVGNPGFGDSRWLADTEPLRWSHVGAATVEIPDAFSHWRHLTNIARPNNGWRIVAGIDDVESANRLVTNLSIPVEQWLVEQPRHQAGGVLFEPSTGNAIYDSLDPNDFTSRWTRWLDNSGSYVTHYANPLIVPPNLYKLSDLDGSIDQDGDGIRMDVGERPQDEFARGSARWDVSRFLADADGDGFTDSFWFLAPTMVERGVRQVVAVRIVDNSALLNVNVATRFVPADPVGVRMKTRGATPADLALVGNLAPYDFADPPMPANHRNVGFYDNPDHWLSGQHPATGEDLATIRYDSGLTAVTPFVLWTRHINEVRLGVDTALFPGEIDRIEYWRRAGLSPLSPDPTSAYTPFGIPEEIELRMFHGNNYPWVYSRLEYTTQDIPGGAGFYHSGTDQVGSSEFLGQLSNLELLFDSRRKATVYNGARNDVMPPWLWPSVFPRDVVPPIAPDGDIDPDEERQFFADMRKFDLRRPLFIAGFLIGDADRDGVAEGVAVPGTAIDDDIDDDGDVDAGDHLARLRQYLERALVDRAGNTYIDGEPEMTQRMIASFVANIAGYLDQDAEPLTMDQAIQWVDNFEVYRYIGMERQPFLSEAFVAHVYKSENPATNSVFVIPPGYSNSGQNVVFHEEDPDWPPRAALVVVQIANPFDVPLVLNDPSALSHFKLRVFSSDNTFEADLRNYGTIDPGQPLTLYAIDDQLGGEPLRTPWLTELGLFNDPNAHDVNDATNDLPGNPSEPGWSTVRDDYDSGDENQAIELIRQIQDLNTGQVFDIVVDRIDLRPGKPGGNTDFGTGVVNLDGNPPPGFETPPEAFLDPPAPFPGLVIGSDTHWVEWAHASRAWDLGTPPLGPDQRNPRYVFADRLVESGPADPADGQFRYNGNDVVGFSSPTTFATTQKADIQEHLYSMQMLQKDGDFEQVGELLNVWLFGHELQFNATGFFWETNYTFSEFMRDETFVGDDRRVNRLRVETDTGNNLSAVIGTPPLPTDPSYLLDPAHLGPPLPAGARVFEAFVCDEFGVNPVDVDGDGVFNEPDDEFFASFGNAAFFGGRMTPGLINANTATPEVLRSMPHWYKLVHESPSGPDPARVRLPEAALRYRERLGAQAAFGVVSPDYSDRDADVRAERGFASTGELMLLTKPAPEAPVDEPNPEQYKDSWRVDFGAENPFAFGAIESTLVSTDTSDVFNPVTGFIEADIVAKDAEEANLLFAGMSNLVTTRSDVFTVYFKVRSFRQNPVTRRWDATDPEYIVDDSRYVMLVDRSEVNGPSDKPKILYLEKLPK